MNLKIVLVVTMIAILTVSVITLGVVTVNASNNDRPVTFLIQDDEGVYFWTMGKGETVRDAFEDAADSYGIPYTLGSDSNVSTLFGIAASDGKNWSTLYWNDKNEKWDIAGTSMKNTKTLQQRYVCIVLSADPAGEALCAKNDAVVLEKDLSKLDVRFLLQSPSGLYFKFGVSGDFEFVGEALRAACEKYKIPCELPDSPYWGISVDSLFGIAMTSVPPYVWWGQSTFDPSSGTWKANNLGIGNYPVENLNGNYFGLCYGDSYSRPTVTP